MSNLDLRNGRIFWSICVSLVLAVLGAPAAALPPDPDNAALLYYQAMLARPRLDDATEESVRRLLRDAEPDEKIREYLKRCDKSFEFIEAAARIPQCDWGILYSEGLGEDYPLKELYDLSRLICADGLILAADGHYRAAFERCLTNREFAIHIGDDTIHLYLASLAADARAQSHIGQILGSMPPDAETLTWLQDQIAAGRGAPLSPAKALNSDFEMALQSLRTSPKTLARIRDQLVQKAQDESTKKSMRNLTDEELVARWQEPYAAFLRSAFRIMEGEAPPEEEYGAIERLASELKDEVSDDPSNYMMVAQAKSVLDLYRLQVRGTAWLNILKVAIAIYLEKATTGRLPATLPDGLPKDPYSGQDFVYERTEEGFLLRWQVKPFDEHVKEHFEFKVQR